MTDSERDIARKKAYAALAAASVSKGQDYSWQDDLPEAPPIPSNAKDTVAIMFTKKKA